MLSREMVYEKLKETRKVITQKIPHFKGVLKIADGEWVLMCREFDLLYRRGHWVIHFAFNANSTIVGVIMKEVLKVIDVEIGENFYYSHFKKDTYYHGYDQCRERFLKDLKILSQAAGFRASIKRIIF